MSYGSASPPNANAAFMQPLLDALVEKGKVLLPLLQ
jgi:hypothetical protein